MSNERRRNPDEQGYVLMIVMILLVVLTSAGVYGLRVAQTDIRASAVMRRLEGATNAAETGAAARMAEVMASEDAGASFGNNSVVEQGGWTAHSGPAPAPSGSGAPVYEASDQARFLVAAQPLVAVEANPPPGIQVGTGGQLTLWRIDSFGVSRANAASATGGAQRVSVGVSIWSRGGLSYNSN